MMTEITPLTFGRGDQGGQAPWLAFHAQLPSRFPSFYNEVALMGI